MMSFSGQVALVEILRAFNYIYQLEVWVHHGMVNPVIFTLTESKNDPKCHVHQQCLGGVHYNPVAETSVYQSTSSAPGGSLVSLPNDLVDDGEEEEDIDFAALLGGYDSLLLLCTTNHSCEESTTVVEVNRHHYCALVDTGACVSLVNEKILSQLEATYPTSEECVTLRGIAGGHVATTGIAWLSLTFNDIVITDFPFAIVPGKALPFCFILGCNFIESFTLDISYAEGIFSLTCDDSTAVQSLIGDSPRSCKDRTFYFAGVCSGLANKDAARPRNLVSDLFMEEELVNLQMTHYTLRKLAKVVRENVPVREWEKRLRFFKPYCDALVWDRGLLWYQGRFGSVAVVSKTFLAEVVVVIHQKMAHIGRNKLIDLVSHHCWNPAVDHVARDVCNSCPSCQVLKVSRQSITPPITRIQSDFPFDLVAIDLVEFPQTVRGNKVCLVLVDHHTKWLAATPLKDKQGQSVALAFKHRLLPGLVCCPRRLLSDNGREFVSSAFNGILEEFDIEHVYSTPYKPSSNGAVEHCNRTLSELLRSLITGPADWDTQLPKAVMVYNATVHRQIGVAPSDFILHQSHPYRVKPMVPTPAREHWVEGHPSFIPF